MTSTAKVKSTMKRKLEKSSEETLAVDKKRYPKRTRKAPERYVDANLRQLMLAGENFDEIVDMLNIEAERDAILKTTHKEDEEATKESSVSSESIAPEDECLTDSEEETASEHTEDDIDYEDDGDYEDD